MEGIKSSVEDLFDHAGDIAETYYKLSVVKATEKVSETAAVGTIALLSVAFGLIIFFFIGFGLAWWIGEAMQNMKAGFFIVAGAYSLILIILLLARNSLIKPIVRNSIIRSVYDKQDS